MKLLLFLLLFIPYLSIARACSCRHQYTRSETICDVYSSDQPVYRAKVVSAYCKCLTYSGSYQFSCIRFTAPTNSNNVLGRVEGLFQCENDDGNSYIRYSYSQCGDTITRAGTTNSNVMNTTTNEMVQNVSCTGYDDHDNQTGCAPTPQPCYYTIMIETVYKGNNIAVGQVLNTTGPDVLTSCGFYGRVLTINESYIVGVGGPCAAFNDWSLYDSFSSREINALEVSGIQGSICITHKQLAVVIGVTVPLVVILTVVVIIIMVVVTICAIRNKKKKDKRATTTTATTTGDSTGIKDENELSTNVDDDKSELI